MKRYPFYLAIGLLVSAYPAQAQINLALQADTATVTIDDPLQVRLTVSELTANGPDSLSGYQTQIIYDPAILRFDTLAVSASLGASDSDLSTVIAAPFESSLVLNASMGVIDLSQLSLLTPDALDSRQPAAFTLATLSFTAIDQGDSALRVNQAIAVDAFAEVLAVSTHDTTVQVVAAESLPSRFAPVITQAMPLFDGTVQAIRFAREGLNDSGQLVFQARIERFGGSDQWHIVRADPLNDTLSDYSFSSLWVESDPPSTGLPVINNAGVVAYRRNGMDLTHFIVRHDALGTRTVEVSAQSLGEPRSLSINGFDTVVFNVNSLPFESRLIRVDANDRVDILATLDGDYGAPSLNDDDEIAVKTHTGSADCASEGVTTLQRLAADGRVTLIDTCDPLRRSLQSAPVINQHGVIAFLADSAADGPGVFTSKGKKVKTLAITPVDTESDATIAFNDDGMALARSGDVVYLATRAGISLLLDGTDPDGFRPSTTVSFNNEGDVALTADFGLFAERYDEGLYLAVGAKRMLKRLVQRVQGFSLDENTARKLLNNLDRAISKLERNRPDHAYAKVLDFIAAVDKQHGKGKFGADTATLLIFEAQEVLLALLSLELYAPTLAIFALQADIGAATLADRDHDKLNGELETALEKMGEGKLDKAAQRLAKFIARVTKFKNDSLDPMQGDAWIAQAQAIQATLLNAVK